MKKFLQRISKVLLCLNTITLLAFASRAQDVELYYSDYSGNGNLYKLPLTTKVPQKLIDNVKASQAFIEGNKYYALHSTRDNYNTSEIYLPKVAVYDLETLSMEGQLWKSTEPTDRVYKCFGIAKHPSGETYGVFYDNEFSSETVKRIVNLSKVSFEGSKPILEKIGTLNDEYWHGLAINANGDVYGFAGGNGEPVSLYRIYPEIVEDGKIKMDKIGSTGYTSKENYFGSACFDKKSNVLYFSAMRETGSAFWPSLYTDIVTIDLKTGEVGELIYTSYEDTKLGGLTIAAPAFDDNAPSKCENVSLNFVNGSLNGTVTLQAPLNFYNGEPGSGDLMIKVLANGEEIKSQNVNWGENLSLDLEFQESGLYNISVYAENEAGTGEEVNLEKFIGIDSPASPEAELIYDNEIMTVSWLPVTDGANGGWIDASNVSYKVTRYVGDVATVVSQNQKETSFSESYPENEKATVYYEIVAVSNELESNPGKTNEITLGFIIPEYHHVFANGGLTDFTIIDGNEDGKIWHLSNGIAIMEYNMSKAMDDWMITPAIKLEKGKIYKFSVRVKAENSRYPEKLEVKFGKSPDVASMTQDLITKQTIDWTLYKDLEAEILTTESGKYYIGFHGCSDSDKYYLYIQEFKVEAPISLDMPEKCENVEVNFIEDSLEGNITLKAPSKFKNGEDGNGDLYVNVKIGDNSPISVKAEWGKEMTIPVQMEQSDVYNFSVYASNEDGEGEITEITRYVGLDVPVSAKPYLKYSNNTMSIDWMPVSTSVHENLGGWIDKNAISYTINRVLNNESVEIASSLTVDDIPYIDASLDFDNIDGNIYYEVIVVAGQSLSDAAKTEQIKLGAIVPYYSVDFNEDLNNLDDYTIIDANNDYTTWKITEDNLYTTVVGISYSSYKMDDWFITPAFKLEKGKSYKFTTKVKAYRDYEPERIEIKIGREAKVESMTDFIPATTVGAKSISLTEEIIPNETGKYYIGFHGISDPDMWYLYIYGYTIEEGVLIPVDYPAPTDLTGYEYQGSHFELTWSKPEFVGNEPVTEEHLIGYKVYRDKALLTDSHITELLHQDKDVIKEKDNSYVYGVTAVYQVGDDVFESDPIEASFVVTSVDMISGAVSVEAQNGRIVIKNADGLDINITSVSGISVYRDRGEMINAINVAGGIYIVTVGNKTYKVVVK